MPHGEKLENLCTPKGQIVIEGYKAPICKIWQRTIVKQMQIFMKNWRYLSLYPINRKLCKQIVHGLLEFYVYAYIALNKNTVFLNIF